MYLWILYGAFFKMDMLGILFWMNLRFYKCRTVRENCYFRPSELVLPRRE